MQKILNICIPTYKRPATLLRCIDSIVRQIESESLFDSVGIYVANDASPDDTAVLLRKYQSLNYFKAITRKQNFGMSQNIRHMLQEASEESSYQLIVTDDDYINLEVLNGLVRFLQKQEDSGSNVPAYWTPRYSYRESGELFTIVCKSFNEDSLVNPTAFNTGRYMFNGFVLSGLIVRAEKIDYEFWETYKENAFFPTLFFGDLIYRFGAGYLNKNIVHHTVLNECHWDRWGKNQVVIKFRLFADFANVYPIMVRRVGLLQSRIAFYCASFPSIYGIVSRFLSSAELKFDRHIVREAINELKVEGVLKFEWPLRSLMVIAYILVSIVTVMNILFYMCILIFIYSVSNVVSFLRLSSSTRVDLRKNYYKYRLYILLGLLRSTPIALRVII